MKCFISYQRFNADTLQGERIVVSQTYTTFDSAEMDRFEDFLRETISMGFSIEYDIDKCIDAERRADERTDIEICDLKWQIASKDQVIEDIKAEIEQTTDNYNPMRDAYDGGYVMAIRDVLQIIDKYTKGDAE